MTEPRSRFDIVVVGAGPAGLAAACAAAEKGKRVAVVDDAPSPGGQIWKGEQSRLSIPQAQKWIERFRRSGATLLDRTAVIAAPEPGVLLAEHPEGAREIEWSKLIIATGARELFLPFPGWTLTGVMGPGGLQALVKGGWPIAGKRVVICGTGPLLLAVADGLKKQGATIAMIAEQAPMSRVAGFGFKTLRHPGKLVQGMGIFARLRGVPYRCGVWPVQANGGEQVNSVTLADGSNQWTEKCDLLACGFHLVPNVELPLAMGCELAGGCVRVDANQLTTVPDVYCSGEPTGIGGVDCALTEGQIAGYSAAGSDDQAAALSNERAGWHAFRLAMSNAFALREELKSLANPETTFCRCEDVAFGRVKAASGWREAKLLTRCGMGACQGRTCGAAAKFILGWGMESVRPPLLPARVGNLTRTNR